MISTYLIPYLRFIFHSFASFSNMANAVHNNLQVEISNRQIIEDCIADQSCHIGAADKFHHQ